jgi:hypothetical protein
MLFDDLLVDLQDKFDSIEDPRRQYNHKYSLKNILLSGVALFSLKIVHCCLLLNSMRPENLI